MSAIVDFLSLTFRPAGNPREFAESLLRVFLGSELVSSLVDTGHGWNGYETMLELPGLGLVAYGGNHGTLHLSLTGSGCAVVRCWDDVADLVEAHDAKITRIDCAHDDFDGVHSVDWGVAEYESGGFKPSRGCSPNAQFVDDMGSNKGRTLYVGSRESGKLCRIYEKGKQLGDPSSSWVRHEVEFRASHRVLTADMIRNPAHYLAGAYSCFEWVSRAQQSRIKTLIAMGQASISKAVDHAKKQAGKCLHMMLQLNGGDIGAAFETLHRPDIPKRCREMYATAQNLSSAVRPPDWWRDASPAEKLGFWRSLAGFNLTQMQGA